MSPRDEESSESSTQASPRSWHRRVLGGLRRRWLVLLLSLVATLALLVVGAVLLLGNLEHPWVKGKVEYVLSELVGTDVQYERLSLSPFSGLQVQGFVLATPAALRPHAAEMLRVEELSIPIDIGALFSGDLLISAVHGGPVQLTVVIHEDGRNSFLELLQSEEEASDTSTSLSRSLEALEQIPLRVDSIRLTPIRLRTVEVARSGAQSRETNLESLGIFSDAISLGSEANGSISLGPAARDDVTLSVLDADDGDPTRSTQVRTAILSPQVDVRLESNQAVAVHANAHLRDQSLFPELRPIDSLLRLELSATFEPDHARTTLQIDHFSVLDSMLVAKVRAVLHDTSPGMDDEASPTEAPYYLPFSTASLDGHGSVEAASLPWVLPWLSVDNLKGRFELQGLKIDSSGVSAGTATVEGGLQGARYSEAPVTIALDGVALSAVLSAQEDPKQALGALKLQASVEGVGLQERGRLTAALRGLAAAVELQGLGAQDSGMWGLKGTGTVVGSVQHASLKANGVSSQADAAMALDVDLAKHRIAGNGPIKAFVLRRRGYAPIAIRDAQVDLVARDPLNWTTDDGDPAIEVGTSVDRVSIGKRHFRARELSFEAKRTATAQYAFDALLTADNLNWGKFRRAPKSSLSVQATVDTDRPALDATGALSIVGSKPTRFSLSASHDQPTTRYRLVVKGTEAGPLLGAILFGDGGHRSDEFSFAFESQGAFRGLVSKDQSGSLVMSKTPLRTTRGTHHSELSVRRLALMRAGLTHQLQGLEVETRSTHEAPGHGAVEVDASIAEASYGEASWPITGRDYAQTLQVAYAALHGAPSLTVETTGSLGELVQPYVQQYPVRDVTFGAELDVDDTTVFAVRHAYWRNPAGGTRFEARGAYEGWTEALRNTEVCSAGLAGCPEVASMYGREAATVTGTFEQDFSFWQSTERTKSGGSLVLPFTIESGDLNTYRILATTEFHDVVLELPQYGILIDDLDALIPVDQEFATEPSLFVVPAQAANAMAQKRFFDLYPFTKRDSFFTADRLQFGQEVIGPVAANVQVVGSAIAMDQLHASYRGGFVTGQFLADLNKKDPKVMFRGHLTGVRVKDGDDVLDANLAMTFVPTTLIVQGKAQIVRVSKDHLYEIIDVLDPYHEDEDLNRVRLGLKFGYPKFVLIKFNEGLMNAKIDLGGLAGAIRIDEIKGIPVTPFLEQYVQPYIERILSPSLKGIVPPPEGRSTQEISMRPEVRE